MDKSLYIIAGCNNGTMKTNEYNEELVNKILIGLEKSYQKLIATKKRNNEDLIILRDNKIVRVQPAELTTNH